MRFMMERACNMARGVELSEKQNSTRAVDRALILFKEVIMQEDGATLTQLSRATELSPSTSLRLLNTLVQHGMVEKEEYSGRYLPGSIIKQIGALALRKNNLFELAGPHLKSLAREANETASLGIAVDQDKVLYLRQYVPETRQISTTTWTGRTIPRENTALGAALFEDGERTYHISRRPDSDIAAVAVSIRDFHDEIIGGLSINAPAYRTSDDDLSAFGELLLTHAQMLSKQMNI